MRVRDARDAYLAANGFHLADYDAPRTPASFFGLTISVPNTPHHAWAIRLHDLHHVVTGYKTDLRGEAEISHWEMAAGLDGLNFYVRSIVTSIFLVGLVLAPRRSMRAWKRGRAARALWNDPTLDYESLLELSVDELRARVDTGLREAS